MWFKANDEVKLRWKAMWFASNEAVICFISLRNLRQIAMWLASSYIAKRQKWRPRNHKTASHRRKKQTFISIWLRHEMLKTGKQSLQNAQGIGSFSSRMSWYHKPYNACRRHFIPIILAMLLQPVRAFGHWHTIVGGLSWCRRLP